MPSLVKMFDECSRRNLEVFHVGGKEALRNRVDVDNDYHGMATRAGWYWWSCCPGCLPDSDPFGPYTSATRAAEAALD